MKRKLLLLCLLFVVFNLQAQNEGIIPVQVKEKFSDFSLTDQSGKIFTLSEYEGKKVMLVFLRGKVTENIWCPICQYQYLEFLKFEKEKDLRQKYNVEVVFVLPYKIDSLSSWTEAFPRSLETIDSWKNPKEMKKGVKEWMEYCKEFFPYDFKFDASKFKLDFPVLFDEERLVSKSLFLFKEEWGGTKVAQNVPTIFIIDEKGKVAFKYHSQYTNDRPDVKYLMKYMEKMM